jgi:hypothetical protein
LRLGRTPALAALLALGTALGAAAGPRQQPGGEAAARADVPATPAEHAYFEALSLFHEARKLDPPRERVRLLAALGEAVWPRDPDASRRFWHAAFETAIEPADDESDPQTRGEQGIDYLLSVVARYDATLADAFVTRWIDALQSRSNAEAAAPDQIGTVAVSLLSAAERILPTNRDRGISLFRQSVSQLFSENHLWFLAALRAKDAALADRMFAMSLEAVETRGPRTINEVTLLGTYLFAPSPTVNSETVDGVSVDNLTERFTLPARNRDLAHRYLAFAYGLVAAHRFGSTAHEYLLLASLRDRFAESAPERRADVDSLLARLAGSMEPADVERLAAMAARRTPDAAAPESGEAFAARAEALPAGPARDHAFLRSIVDSALAAGDYSRAEALVWKIENPRLSSRIAQYIAFMKLLEAYIARPAPIDDAAIGRFGDPMLRSLLHYRTALVFVEKRNAQRVAESLGAALHEADRVGDANAKAHLKLLCARTYAAARLPQSVETLRYAAQDLNRADGFDPARFLLYYTIESGGETLSLPTDGAGANVLFVVEAVAEADYWGTLAVCKAFDDPLLRAWTTMRVLRSAIRRPPETDARKRERSQ